MPGKGMRIRRKFVLNSNMFYSSSTKSYFRVTSNIPVGGSLDVSIDTLMLFFGDALFEEFTVRK